MAVAVTIICADVLDGLRELADESVQCVVTSPPYWGLRDYGVPGQLGLERTPAEYVERMAGVFREVRRVLRKDGTLWLNMGDCYASSPPGCQNGGVSESSGLHGVRGISGTYRETLRQSVGQKRNTVTGGLKAKDLVGMPWRLAFALQADGWWLRSDIIWHKTTCMPESVKDRPTKAHEYLFLLAKADRYYYDSAAIKTQCNPNTKQLSYDTMDFGRRVKYANGAPAAHRKAKWAAEHKQSSGRRMIENVAAARRAGGSHDSPFGGLANARTVWSIAPQAFQQAHFATFPEELPTRCIKAGCPEGGTVLDPFGGAGTTGLVAAKLGRNAILIELNPKYAEMARARIAGEVPLLADVVSDNVSNTGQGA